MRRISTLTVCVIVLMSLIWGASPEASVQADSRAISPGCAYINQNSALDANNSTVDTTGLTLNAGEVITISITSGNGLNLFIYNFDTNAYEAGDETTPLPQGSVLT